MKLSKIQNEEQFDAILHIWQNRMVMLRRIRLNKKESVKRQKKAANLESLMLARISSSIHIFCDWMVPEVTPEMWEKYGLNAKEIIKSNPNYYMDLSKVFE